MLVSTFGSHGYSQSLANNLRPPQVTSPVLLCHVFYNYEFDMATPDAQDRRRRNRHDSIYRSVRALRQQVHISFMCACVVNWDPGRVTPVAELGEDHVGKPGKVRQPRW